MLTPKMQSEILFSHFSEGKSIRRIAIQFGVNRKSVDRLLKRGRVAVEKSFSERGSMLDPYLDEIKQLLRENEKLTVKVIFLKIRQKGFKGSYSLVRECVPGLRNLLEIRKPQEAFFSLDFAIGQAAQVDWGEFKDYFEDGVRLHCFVMVLCYSRKIYIEFTRSEKFEEFIRCHENAFRYFGGKRTIEIWYDNLPTAVSERMGRLVKFNNRFYAYAGHHRFKPIACNKARGNEKGRVENGVKYVRNNFWPSRHFTNFEDLKMQSIQWRDETANSREHEVTKKIPHWVYESEEKYKLESINSEPYETDEVFSIQVKPDYHIIYETNKYSVPWTLVGIVITVRIDSDWIKVFYKERFITKHVRCYKKNQKNFTKSEHESGLIERKPQGEKAHINSQISTLENYGEYVREYLRCLQNSPRSLKKEISTLLALATIYGYNELNEAIKMIIDNGSFGADKVEKAIKNKNKRKNPAPLSLNNEDLKRIPARVDLEYYDALLFTHKDEKEE